MSSLNVPNDFTNGTTADAAQVNANFTAIETWGNGSLDSTNFTSGTNQKLGLSDGSTARRGKSIIATEQTRTNAAYGLLTTPDRVDDIVLPEDGLLYVYFSASWKCSTASAGRAAIFLNSTQVNVDNAGADGIQEACSSTSATNYSWLGSSGAGLMGGAGSIVDHAKSWPRIVGAVQARQIDQAGGPAPTTAVPQGGMCVIEALAGTYDVSIQYKSATGTVSVKDRWLFVKTETF